MTVLALIMAVLAAIAFIVALVKEYRTSGMSALSWAFLGFVALSLTPGIAALSELID